MDYTGACTGFLFDEASPVLVPAIYSGNMSVRGVSPYVDRIH